MNIMRMATPVALFTALSLAPLPAAAQGRGREGRGGQRTERAAGQNRSGERQAAQRSVAPRNGAAAASRGRVAPAPRPFNAPRPNVAPRDNNRRDVPRGFVTPRNDVRRDAPRVFVTPRNQARRDAPRVYVAPRHDGRRDAPRVYVAPRPGYRAYPRVVVARPHVFARPYYAFRPRVRVGFGLWLGFGVPYPHAWIGSYPPPVYGYYGGAFGVVPNATAYGGISFDISPLDASVFVDGEYVGVAADFGPDSAPLTLLPGRHRVEVQAEGYGAMSTTVDVFAGQVVPFQGTMQPY